MSRGSARARRIAVLSSDYPPTSHSGIGPAVERQVENLADLGWEVVLLLATDQTAAQVPRRTHPRVVVHPLERWPWPAEIQAADCVHVHSLRLGNLALSLARRLRRPLVYSVHGFVARELGLASVAAEPKDGGRTRARQPAVGSVPDSGRAAVAAWSRFQIGLMRAADTVLLLSRSEQEIASRLAPSVTSRSHVIGNSVPTTLPPPPCDRREGPVVFAGRWTASKGIDLIRQLLTEGDPPSLGPWVLAGGRPDAAGRSLLQRLDSVRRPWCKVAGWLDRQRLFELYRRAVAVIVPSRYEPFGLVALEAMAQGAPVVASDAGGLKEVVGEGSGGSRLCSRDPGIWGEAIRRLRADRGVSEELQRCGPEFVRRRFGGPKLARRLVDEVYLPLCT